MGGLVGAPAFNRSFGTPTADMIGTIVAIYESVSIIDFSMCDDMLMTSGLVGSSLVPFLPQSSARSSEDAGLSSSVLLS